MEVTKQSEEKEVTGQIVKNEKIVEKVSNKEAGEKTALGQIKNRRASPKIPKGDSEKREITEKTQKAGADKPIQKNVVRPVKPLLGVVKSRIVILIENGRIIFRPREAVARGNPSRPSPS